MIEIGGRSAFDLQCSGDSFDILIGETALTLSQCPIRPDIVISSRRMHQSEIPSSLVKLE
jgi:hypothetical protein